MARVLLVCSDPSERTLLQACLKGDDVATVKTFKDAAKALTSTKAELAVVRLDARDTAGMEVLRLMKRSQMQVPTVAVLGRQGGPLEFEARQLGVQWFLSGPIRYDEFRKVIEKAQAQARKGGADAMPAITDAERKINLSVHVSDLHKTMKCPAGTNRVTIRSVVTGIGKKTEPRVALRCPIRQSVGLSEYVYFEYIQKYCCGKPKACEAVIQYKKMRQAKG